MDSFEWIVAAYFIDANKALTPKIKKPAFRALTQMPSDRRTTAAFEYSLANAVDLLKNVDISAILHQAFIAFSQEVESNTAFSFINQFINTGQSPVTIEILNGHIMAGLHGAYTASNPDREERIYLNSEWLANASVLDITKVILEEIGHAIDYRINNNIDTIGDEGSIFAALVLGEDLPKESSTENDHHYLQINGELISVEAATPLLDSSASPELISTSINDGIPSGAVGTLVSDLIDSGGSHNNFTDSDNDSPAIAITGTNLAGGTLYYSTDNGSNWSDIGTVSDTSARVLYADSNTRLAFTPATDYNGTINDLITFKAWDRSSPTSISSTPTLTGTYDTSGSARSVTLSADGNTAFVADTSGGLDIIDVSNPASPTLTGTYDTSGLAQVVTLSPDGNTAFVADYDEGLQIINVSDPSTPTLTATFDTMGFAYGVTLSADGNTAYVADGADGLDIIDVSNPSTPTLTATFDTSGIARDVTLSADGNTAYVADGNNGIQILDISDPTFGIFISGMYVEGTANAYDVTLSADGNTAFVANGGEGMQILDLRDASVRLIDQYDTSGTARGVTLSADGNTAFVADDGGGLQIIDVSNPDNPNPIATYDTSGLALGVTLSPDGNTAFVAEGFFGLQTIDVTDSVENGASGIATIPTLTGTYDISGSAVDVTLSADGNTAFVADQSSGLQIIDVSNPGSPTLTGTYETSANAQDVTLSADGKTAFVADGEGGLDIIDVSDPTSPTLTSNYETPDALGSARCVTLSADGNTAFVAYGLSGLQIIDVSNPGSPTLTGTYETSDWAVDVTLSPDGNTAFVAAEDGLDIIDVSDPTSPTLTGTYNTSGTARGVTLSADGNTAFVADGEDGLDIIDVSDPTSPTLTGTYNTSGNAQGVTLSADGNTAFVADREDGLDIIDVSDPTSPTLTGTYNTSNLAIDVTLSADGNTAYVADSANGLDIIDVSNTKDFSNSSDTASIETINDAPILTTPNSGSISEVDESTNLDISDLSGRLEASDPNGQSITYGITNGEVESGVSSVIGDYGTLFVNTTSGAYTYTPETIAIEALNEGDSQSDIFTITANDGIDVTTTTYTVSISGANEADDTSNNAPTLTTPESGVISEDADSSNISSSALSGTLDASDPDDDSLTFGITNGEVESGVSSVIGDYGTLVVNTDTGAYTYTPETIAIEALNKGDIQSDIFTITANDGIDRTTTTYTVNIFGANELGLPTISSTAFDFSTSKLVVTGTNLAAHGVELNDIDVSKLTITGEGESTYVLTSSDVQIDSNKQFTIELNAPDLLQLAGLLNKNGLLSPDGTAYNISAASGWNSGANSSPEDKTNNSILVSNFSDLSNSAPTLTPPETGTIREVDKSTELNSSALSGTLEASDLDGDIITFGITGGEVVDEMSSIMGEYGTLSVNTTSGAYIYTPETFAIEALNQGDKQSDIFTITAFDGIEITTNTYTVNILGMNEPKYKTINGNRRSNKITGSDGAEKIFTFGARDYIKARGGNDIIDPGTPRKKGGKLKHDHVNGGDGKDTIVIKNGYGVILKNFDVSEDKLDMRSFSGNISWNMGTIKLNKIGVRNALFINDEIFNDKNNTEIVFINTPKSQFKNVPDVNDITIKGKKNLNLYKLIKGDRGTNQLAGSRKSDIILGEANIDNIRGNQGDDIIDVGQPGTRRGRIRFDLAKGGNGKDTFVIKDGYKINITDFSVKRDILDLSELDPNYSFSRSNGNTFIQDKNDAIIAELDGKFKFSAFNIIEPK